MSFALRYGFAIGASGGLIALLACMFLPQNPISNTSTIALSTKEPELGLEQKAASEFEHVVLQPTDLTVSLERPLFSPTRRAVNNIEEIVREQNAKKVEPAPPKTELSQLKLLGIVSNANNARALLSITGREAEWLSLNEDIQGWTLEEISQQWIELKNGDETRRVHLFE